MQWYIATKHLRAETYFFFRMTSKPEIKFTQLFINNEFVDSVSGKTFATIDPTDETEIAQISEGDKADVDKAVKAARKAFEIGKNWHFYFQIFSFALEKAGRQF